MISPPLMPVTVDIGHFEEEAWAFITNVHEKVVNIVGLGLEIQVGLGEIVSRGEGVRTFGCRLQVLHTLCFFLLWGRRYHAVQYLLA
jgi:hypothetical protein